jgi:hypothetical protein
MPDAAKSGPPKLCIIGIDVPQPSFHPFKRIEDSGKRLFEYTKIFNIPFQYKE